MSPQADPCDPRGGTDLGVPRPAGWEAVATLGDLLVRTAQAHPRRRALVIADEALGYTELLDRAREVARGLTALGVQRGDHVGLLLINGSEFAEAALGAAYIGAVVVPLNPRYRTHELTHAIATSDIVVLVTTNFDDAYTDFPALVRSCMPPLPDVVDPTGLELDVFPKLRAAVLLGGGPCDGFLTRDEFTGLADRVTTEAIEAARARVRVRDAAFIMFTSGTTANPKGCVLTHEAVTRGAVERARHRLRTGDHDIVWSPGPLFHMGSLMWLVGAVGTGGTFVSDTYFEPGRALELIRRERPTIGWPLFPAIMSPLLQHPDFTPDLFATVRKMLLIGPEPLLEQVQDLFPHLELVTSCGMTEMAGIYALSSPDEDRASRARTQGRPLPGVEVQIVRCGGDGELVDVEEAGELWVRGPCMMDGYYNDPEATARAVDPDGWLHTGDLYLWASNGNLVFAGRIKDMLKVGGENVSALEIEFFLCGHPEVIEASVVGIPDDRFDEVPVAFVELTPGATVTPDDLLEYCLGRIARFRTPREVIVVAPGEWPMSTTKIDKVELRRRLIEADSGS